MPVDLSCLWRTTIQPFQARQQIVLFQSIQVFQSFQEIQSFQAIQLLQEIQFEAPNFWCFITGNPFVIYNS